MKKISKLTAIGLSCAMAFPFVACGGDNGGGSNPTDNAPNPDAIKTEQVTELQWKSAFDFYGITNVTLKYTERATANGQSDETYRLSKFDGNKVYEKEIENEYDPDTSTVRKVTEEVYYSIDGSTIYEYSYDDEDKSWYRKSSNWCPSVSYYYARQLEMFKNVYGSFTYSSDKNAYVATEIPDFNSDFDTVSVKITDGKVSVIQMDSITAIGTASMTQSMILQAYDYGTTTVALPELKGEINNITGDYGGLTEDEWNDALSADAFLNVTMHRNYEADDLIMSSTTKYDYENKRILEINETNQWYTTEINGEIRIYGDFGDGWEFVKIEEGDIKDNFKSIVNIFSTFDYDLFTYNRDNDSYRATDYEFESKSYTVVLKFDSHDNLVSCVMTATSGDAEEIEYVFYDYGDTVVEAQNINGTAV